MFFFAIISVAILVFLLIAVALQPLILAHYLANLIIDKSTSWDKQTGFWRLFEQVRFRRRLVIAFLLLLVALLLLASFYLLNRIVISNGQGNSVFVASGIGLLLVTIFGLVQYLEYGKVNIPHTAHGRIPELRQILENLSIASGVSAPEVAVLSHSCPAAFSLRRNFKQTVIYVTSALVNLCTTDELKAVLAREQAFHLARHNSDYRLIANLLTMLKALGFAFFFLILAVVNPALPFVAFAGMIILYLRILQESREEWAGSGKDPFSTVILITNPPFLLIYFLSYLIYYYLCWKESIYADLKAVELTRYPYALYSALAKLAQFKGNYQLLPSQYLHLYLSGELAARGGVPMIQPTIAERLAILRRLDSTLAAAEPDKSLEVLSCPVCGRPLAEVPAKDMYDRDRVFYECLHTNHLWFDGNSLYEFSSPALNREVESVILEDSLADKPEEGRLVLCPRCRIPLARQADNSIPDNIDIYSCASCRGDLVSSADFKAYVVFRQKKSQGLLVKNS